MKERLVNAVAVAEQRPYNSRLTIDTWVGHCGGTNEYVATSLSEGRACRKTPD